MSETAARIAWKDGGCTSCGKLRDGSHHSYCRACYNAYKREKYRANSAAEVERSKAWNKANRERVAANMRAVRARDPEGQRARANAWRAANPGAAKNHDHNKRLRRLAATKGAIPGWQMEIVVETFSESACHYCGTRSAPMTVDHVIPLARGGRHEIKNLVPACKPCNSAKHALPPEVFALRRGRLCW